MLSAVERLDADLLELTEIDRDTGTIWFLYHRPLTTVSNYQASYTGFKIWDGSNAPPETGGLLPAQGSRCSRLRATGSSRSIRSLRTKNAADMR